MTSVTIYHRLLPEAF
uniref:Uncharacterized protein n=1 Tax=Anguilla anguilla TaxID=7936 RepID=A0A0E9UIN6_ANGAN